MKRLGGLVVLVALAIGSAPLLLATHQAETNQPYAQAHIERERNFWNALKNKNQTEINGLIGTDALFVNQSGIESANDFRSALSSMSLANFSLSDFSVREPNPTTAIVTYRVTESGNFQGHAVPASAYVSSVWLKHAGRWILELRQLTPTG